MMGKKEELKRSIDMHLTALNRMQEQLEQLEEQPEDVYQAGAVLVVETFNYYLDSVGQVRTKTDSKLTYAFLKVWWPRTNQLMWYPTGQTAAVVSWETILELAEGGELWEATEFTEVVR